jgi:hypothetical protein
MYLIVCMHMYMYVWKVITSKGSYLLGRQSLGSLEASWSGSVAGPWPSWAALPETESGRKMHRAGPRIPSRLRGSSAERCPLSWASEWLWPGPGRPRARRWRQTSSDRVSGSGRPRFRRRGSVSGVNFMKPFGPKFIGKIEKGSTANFKMNFFLLLKSIKANNCAHNFYINLCICGLYVLYQAKRLFENFFWPKWCFIKSIPGVAGTVASNAETPFWRKRLKKGFRKNADSCWGQCYDRFKSYDKKWDRLAFTRMQTGNVCILCASIPDRNHPINTYIHTYIHTYVGKYPDVHTHVCT